MADNRAEWIAKLLAEHRFSIAMGGCTCGLSKFPPRITSTQALLSRHEAHVSAVVDAWLAGQEPKWQWEFQSLPRMFSGLPERIRRRVTEWEPA